MYARQKQSRLFVFVLALFGTVLVGCGDGRPELVPVSGQVFINDKPLAAGVDGFVRVEPETGRAATGRIDPSDGRFTLSTFEPDDGCMEGTHAVAVIVNATANGQTTSLIPEKYREAGTSGLTVTIDGATDALRIDLSGKLKRAAASGGENPAIDDPGPM